VVWSCGGRYWDLIQRHRVTQFYTAPTAIRALMRFGTAEIATYDKTSLRVLGSVGEPINPEAWRWCVEVVRDFDLRARRTDGGVFISTQVLPACGGGALHDRGHVVADGDGRPHGLPAPGHHPHEAR
jgi:hypothetical protein